MEADQPKPKDLRTEASDDEERTAATVSPDESSEPQTPKEPDPVPEEPRPGRLAQLAARLSRRSESSREAKSGERTRGLVVLAGSTIACLFLFFGLFTTDSSTNRKQRKTTPSLGRPQTGAVDPDSASRSPVPQLSVNQHANDESAELTERDLLRTMRNRGTPPPGNVAPPANPSHSLSTVNIEDPALADAYRRRGLPMTDFQARPTPPEVQAPVGNASDPLRKSSIVFVRSGGPGGAQVAPMPTVERHATGLLPQGTALVARLQHSVSSAARTPVTAVIEYNYGDGGELIVPAGTKAYGELSQATPQGWVSIKFHTLEFPSGEQEKINGSAISMERRALRGDVNGKNRAKKFLTRALTGVGTI